MDNPPPKYQVLRRYPRAWSTCHGADLWSIRVYPEAPGLILASGRSAQAAWKAAAEAVKAETNP